MPANERESTRIGKIEINSRAFALIRGPSSYAFLLLDGAAVVRQRPVPVWSKHPNALENAGLPLRHAQLLTLTSVRTPRVNGFGTLSRNRLNLKHYWLLDRVPQFVKRHDSIPLRKNR
jgi:hypothetical protein